MAVKKCLYINECKYVCFFAEYPFTKPRMYNALSFVQHNVNWRSCAIQPPFKLPFIRLLVKKMIELYHVKTVLLSEYSFKIKLLRLIS